MRDVRAIARLDFAEVMRSRWLLVCLGVYGAVAAVFVLVGLRESLVVDFTGMSRVLFSLCHALLLLLPLIALSVTGQVINQARDAGALEFFLSQPVRRASYLGAVTAVRTMALALPLVALLLILGGVGRLALGQAVPWSFVARAALLCTVLLWAFAALGIAISVYVRSPARSMAYILLAWAIGVSLIDFGLVGIMLTWRLNPQAVFLLAVLNPVQSVRIALLAAAEPDLATLGPVGFYVANQLGQRALLALGVGWPLLFGALAWMAALRGFRRRDLV